MVLKPSLRLLQSDPNPNPKFAKVPGRYQSPEQPRHLPAVPAKKSLFPDTSSQYWAFFKSAPNGKGRGKARASPVGIDSCQSHMAPAEPSH